MATYNFLDFKGLQTYNEKIKSFIATSISTAISNNNTAINEKLTHGESAYQAWVKFLSGTFTDTPVPTLATIQTDLTNLGNDKANKTDVYTTSQVYTKDETNAEIAKVKVSVKNETTGTNVKLNQSVDSTGRQITLTIDESGLNTALDGKVSKNGTDRLMTAAEGTKLGNIEAGAQVNKIESITVTGGDSNISASISNKAATIDLSSFATNTELNTAKSTIDNYTVNGKKISTSPTLTAADINNGDVTVSKEISDIKTSINTINSAIAGGTHFIGVATGKLPDTANNGDIVIFGNKEYIYNKPEGSTTGNWVELGDTTAELKAIDDNAKAIKAIQDDKTYVKEFAGNNSTYVTVGGSIANNKLTLTVSDTIANTFLTKANAESTYATKTDLADRQITVGTTKQGEQVQVTLSNESTGNTVKVSVDETGLTNTLSTINTNITNITKDNGIIDTKISGALDTLDYTLAKTGTTTTNGTAYSLTVMCGITQTDGKITATSTDTIGNITDAQINGLF